MTVLHGLITLADVGDTSLRNIGNHTHTHNMTEDLNTLITYLSIMQLA